MEGKELVTNIREENTKGGKVILRAIVAGGQGYSQRKRDLNPRAEIMILSEGRAQIVLGHSMPSDEPLFFFFSVIIIIHDQCRSRSPSH